MIPGFTENWFDAPSQQALAQLTHEVWDVPGDIIEIGSWEGRSTVALANAAHPRIVHAVDTWAGSPGEISSELAERRDVFARWQTNIDHYTKGNVWPHRMGWRDYLPTLDGLVALAFIDAEHTYSEVKDNIEALLPHIAAGGVICGDDAHHPPVRAAVADALGFEIGYAATLWIWRTPR
jgi:hypothetical protein